MDLSSFEMLTDDFSPLPAGVYEAEVEKIETRVSGKGDEYLAMTLNVVEDGAVGKKIFDNFHLWNPNAKAVEISQRRMGSLFKAAGFPTMGPTDDLLGKQVKVRVKVRDADNGYDASNEVKAYLTSSSPRPMPPTSAAKSAAPWTEAA